MTIFNSFRFRPQRAVSVCPTLEELRKLKYPGVASPKYDGVRVECLGGELLSRKLIRLPNNYLQSTFNWLPYDGFEMEAIIPGKGFRDIQSAIMSEDGQPDVKFMAFDYAMYEGNPIILSGPDARVWRGLEVVKARLETFGNGIGVYPQIEPVKFTSIADEYALLDYYNMQRELGMEGAMYAHFRSLYKYGKSTTSNCSMIRIKPFVDGDAVILGLVRGKTNNNVLETDNLGYAKRSKKKDGLVEIDQITSINVRDIHNGRTFNISSGITDKLGKAMFEQPESYIGKVVKYKAMEYSDYDSVRHPSFIDFRDERDVL